MATVGTGTPVQSIATVIDKGLSMAVSLEELIFKIYEQAKLEKAWKITKRALDNPENRKANLIARRQNPTLAKYSIAYGAVVVKDVVAVSAMNRIGLSRETLAQKDANVGAVKEYLALLYSDDIKVKRRYVPQKGWAAKLPPSTLTPRSWMLTVQVGLDDGGLDGSQDATINRLFSQTAASMEHIEGQKKIDMLDPDAVKEAFNRLLELRSAVDEFVPKTSKGVLIKPLVTHKKLYLDLISDVGGELAVDMK
ncbi:MAG: hypothetical protein ACI8RZ_002227 [Myxococcota bacterium]|jgi:hypothetical protein